MKPHVYPADWLFRLDPPPLSEFGRRLLAEGDSWFTIGTLNLLAASNLLFKMEVGRTTAVVNCAYPGDTLQHMVDCGSATRPFSSRHVPGNPIYRAARLSFISPPIRQAALASAPCCSDKPMPRVRRSCFSRGRQGTAHAAGLRG